MYSHTSSMSNGTSGMSTTVAPPAMPAQAAMCPAWRPITSTTITRSCDSAVVWSRSMASTQICTAVSKPNVSSVADRSLSIVLGTPTTVTPPSRQLVGHAHRVLAADGDEGVEPLVVQGLLDPLGAAVDLVGVGAGRADDRAAPGQRAPHPRDGERRSTSFSITPSPPVAEPEQLVAVDHLPLAHHRAQHGVEPGAVAPSGEHPDAHRANLARRRTKPAGRPSRPAPRSGRP